MAASDVIVTKGGPGAIFEAMARELPMIITNWLPGQEEGNIRFVESHKAGYVSRDAKAIAGLVEKIKNDPEIKENIKKLKKPHAVFDIAKLILAKAGL
jgi:1,2-diacylglycerol 3-beta-galactosyltransferase